jgi:hypothetical protein
VGRIGSVARAPQIFDPAKWSEFAGEFVSQPRANLDLIEPRADPKLTHILRRQIGFDARLVDGCLAIERPHLAFHVVGEVQFQQA